MSTRPDDRQHPEDSDHAQWVHRLGWTIDRLTARIRRNWTPRRDRDNAGGA